MKRILLGFAILMSPVLLAAEAIPANLQVHMVVCGDGTAAGSAAQQINEVIAAESAKLKKDGYKLTASWPTMTSSTNTWVSVCLTLYKRFEIK